MSASLSSSLASSRTTYRSNGVAGIVGGLLFFVAVMGSHLPGGNTEPRSVIDYFGTRSHQVAMVVIAYLMAVAALSIAWFFVGATRRVFVAEGRDGSNASRLATLTAGAVVTSLLLAASALFAMPGPLLFEHGAKVGDQTVTVGWIAMCVIIISMLAAAVTIVAVSAGARRHGSLPRWNVRVGYVCAAILVLGSLMGAPMIAFSVWLIATGVTLVRPAPAHVAPVVVPQSGVLV